MRQAMMLLFCGLCLSMSATAACAFETQSPGDIDASNASSYTDPDEAIENFVDGTGGSPTYQFNSPHRHRVQPNSAQQSAPWESEQRRLVFGPFNRSEYATGPVEP